MHIIQAPSLPLGVSLTTLLPFKVFQVFISFRKPDHQGPHGLSTDLGLPALFCVCSGHRCIHGAIPAP